MNAKKSLFSLCLSMGALALAQPGHSAICPGEQQIGLSFEGQPLDRWTGTSASMRAYPLANGFVLGLKVEQAPREIYARDFAPSPDTQPEWVKISIYDASSKQPRYLTSTYGGSNSEQGYSARGGADRVDELGSKGIKLSLSKPECKIKQADLAAIPTEKELGQVKEHPVATAQAQRWIAQAKEDINKGKYVISYHQGSLPENVLARLTSLLQKDGIEIQLIAEGDTRNSKDYFTGYGRTMFEAIQARFGAEHLQNIELQLKQEYKS